MKFQLPPFHTWEFFQACSDALGDQKLQSIYNRSYSEIRRWCRNPDFTSDSSRNPLDRLETMVEQLDKYGRRDVAEAAVRRLAKTLGLDLVNVEPCVPERETVAEELLDIHPAIVEHAKSCRAGEIRAAEAWERQAIEEIRQATEKARQGS